MEKHLIQLKERLKIPSEKIAAIDIIEDFLNSHGLSLIPILASFVKGS